MLNGFRILLLIVVLLGIVLISGYTHLMFSDNEKRSGKSVAPKVTVTGQKSRTYLEIKYTPLRNTTNFNLKSPTLKPHSKLFCYEKRNSINYI